MGIAASVLEAVRTEAARYPGAHVAKVGLKVGEVSGVEPDSLRFCLEVLAADSEFAPLALEIERVPRSNRCRDCQAVFAVVDYNFTCSVCGGKSTEPAGGGELELAYLELEES
jgi:hydrogenase nickel incorporation protein HypA/HybF